MAGKKARAHKRKRELGDANAANAGQAFPGLPNHLVVAHILRSEYFDDSAGLARLPAVSSAMRDTMAETGLHFKELGEHEAVALGCLSALKRRQRGGRLYYIVNLCEAAARSGHLEELKLFRENGCPWNKGTCTCAAEFRHLEVLQWTHANGCP